MAAATSTGRPGAIRELREALHLTQYDLAQRAGCSVAYVRQLEAGCLPRRSRVLPDVLRVLVPDNEQSPGRHAEAPQKGVTAAHGGS